MMSSGAKIQRHAVTDFCCRIGEDRLLVQGAGGNVSWKDGSTMWVKASGRWLVHAADSEIFVPISLPALTKAIAAADFDVTPRVIGNSPLKPSIETLLHALMPHRYVAHLHAVEPLAYMVREGGVAALAIALGEDIKWQSVPYLKPGAALAQGVLEALNRSPNLDVVLLENHGIVIGADSIPALEQTLTEVVARSATAAPLDAVAPEIHPHVTFDHPSYHRLENDVVQNLAFDTSRFDRLKRDWALFPDHVVFLGAAPFVFDDSTTATSFLFNQSALPELIFVKSAGVFVTDMFNMTKALQLGCYCDVMMRQKESDRIRSLSKADVDALLNWEAEQYRQTLNK